LEDAYWKTEIIDAYCRILLLAKQIGNVTYFKEGEARELLDLKKKLGFDDPRFHVEDCDLCGNTAFRDGYKELLPEPRAFDAPPAFPGYLQSPVQMTIPAGTDLEALVRTITDQVLAALK